MMEKRFCFPRFLDLNLDLSPGNFVDWTWTFSPIFSCLDLSSFIPDFAIVCLAVQTYKILSLLSAKIFPIWRQPGSLTTVTGTPLTGSWRSASLKWRHRSSRWKARIWPEIFLRRLTINAGFGRTNSQERKASTKSCSILLSVFWDKILERKFWMRSLKTVLNYIFTNSI